MSEVVNLDTGEVIGKRSLAIPEPGDVVPAGFAERVRNEIEQWDDFDLVDEYRRRLFALERYVRGKEMRREAQAAARWGEVNVGRLLPNLRGKALTNELNVFNSLQPEERVWFRRMFDHTDIVEECINGIDIDGEKCPPKTSRAAILNEISFRLTRDQAPELPPNTFSCIVIDPPWQMGKIEREERPLQDDEIDYPTLPVDCKREDDKHGVAPLCCLRGIPMRDLAAPTGAHLYLWVTHKYLPAGLDLVEQWGFNYQCLMTWRKNVGITPYSWMYDTEHVIFARRGGLDLERLGLRLSFDAPVVGHSIKPDVFYERVCEASPAPRLEMFSRTSREGFTAWGNEVGDRG